MFSFFIAITIWFVRNERIARIATDTVSRFVHVRTAKVNKYARKGSVVVKRFIAHFRRIKLLFLLKIYHYEI